MKAKIYKIIPTPRKIAKLYTNFIESEKAGGLLLVFATIISLFFANSQWHTHYLGILNQPLGSHTLVEWINDGLMAIFFLLIGLELVREIKSGELSNLKNAALPIFGAFGGMIVPAGIFLLLNYGLPTQSGAGIPMATDIAFAIGILSLLGNRVPLSLKVFLTALAVMDDLGAIIVIAIFYTKTIAFTNLFISLGIWVFLMVLSKLKVKSLIIYLIGGGFMWYFMLHSGIHATITGVLLAFAIPYGNGGEKTPAYRLQDFLHKPVAFLILPIFAIANTGIPIEPNIMEGLSHPNSVGVIVGLVIGKPVGIFLFSLLGVGLGLCALPNDLKWKNILGVGFLGGIGFTMSIFITLLAFDDAIIINDSKIAILIASVISGIIGFTALSLTLKKKKKKKIQLDD